jgi:hypothetical protein
MLAVAFARAAGSCLLAVSIYCSPYSTTINTCDVQLPSPPSALSYLFLHRAQEAAQTCSPRTARDGLVRILDLGVEVAGGGLGGLFALVLGVRVLRIALLCNVVVCRVHGWVNSDLGTVAEKAWVAQLGGEVGRIYRRLVVGPGRNQASWRCEYLLDPKKSIPSFSSSSSSSPSSSSSSSSNVYLNGRDRLA